MQNIIEYLKFNWFQILVLIAQIILLLKTDKTSKSIEKSIQNYKNSKNIIH